MSGAASRRSARLSRAEKAGLLGMVAVVVIILSVVVTSGDRTGAMSLSSHSNAGKTREALKGGQSFESTKPVPRPEPEKRSKAARVIFGPREEDPKSAPLDLESGRKTPRPAATPAARTYKIRNGDTLGHIARRMLGKASRWREILEANPDLNPKNLRVGKEIKIPAR
jgi:nucleoid-associated protein YgaU